MSSPETESLFGRTIAIEDARKMVDRMIVQIGHLRTHVNMDDPVVSYWLILLIKEATQLSIDLEEEERRWHDE